MKKLITLIWILILASPLFATLSPMKGYSNFKKAEELWICTSTAFPIDISYDVFGVDYKTVAQGGYGYFVQVMPGKHTDGSNLPTQNNIVEDPSRGVLNVSGKPAGIYEYIFVVTAESGFCGMEKDDQAVVRVYLVPQITGFPILTNVCPGQTASVDFNWFIPPEIRYFLDNMGWTVSWSRDGKKMEMPFNVGLSSEGVGEVGDMEYQYSINDDAGDYSGKYKELMESAYACLGESATVTHTVKIREGVEYAIPNKSISFCTDVLALVPETWPWLSINLFGYLGSSMPNGKWEIEYIGNSSTSVPSDVFKDELTIDENSGQFGIDLSNMITLFKVDSIVLKYKYNDCLAKETFTLLSLSFNSAGFTKVFSQEQERDICRNLVSGVVELSSIFGFSVPLTSGTWYFQNGNGFEETNYGTVDLSDMRPGSLYTFRYNVNSAVDSFCLIDKIESDMIFRLRMYDMDIANGELKICKSQFASGVIIDNLARYVPGLSDIGKISQITWRDDKGTEINPENYTLKSTEEWQVHDTTSLRMRYNYEVKSNCGQYSGTLSISTIDSIGSDTARKVIICFTDEYASRIDLFQILGIAGADGSFTLKDDPINQDGNKINISGSPHKDILDAVKLTGTLDANAIFDKDKNESETYKFGYIPGRNDVCLKNMDNIVITITVTKNVKSSSSFNEVK
jgi:archaellin